MKEFVEKLIGRLKSKHIPYLGMDNSIPYGTEMLKLFDAISIVNQLAEEYNNGWIDCEKELPETNESILCWAKSTARGGDVCFVGSYDKGFWFLQSYANTHSFPGQYKIVAWQPLPEPFKPSAE